MGLHSTITRNRTLSVYRDQKLFFLFFFFVFSYVLTSEGLVFSRTPVCRSGASDEGLKCKNLLTGVLTLRNDETVKVIGSAVTGDDLDTTRAASIHDPSRRGISIKLEKSNVRFVYDLQYELDAFSEFYEDIYEFTYQDVGHDPGHFCYVEDVERCNRTGEAPQTPEGHPLLFGVGRCCWCASTPLYGPAPGGSLGGTTRSAGLKCSTVDVLFGRSIWATKSCPRIRGPWYTGMRINQWRWEFSILVRLEWYSPSMTDDPNKDGILSPVAQAAEHACLETMVNSTTTVLGNTTSQRCFHARSHRAAVSFAEYTLNVSVPEIYDETYGIGCRITGSLPQTDAFPPSLETYRLFIPTYPLTDPLVRESKLKDNCGIRLTESVSRQLSSGNVGGNMFASATHEHNEATSASTGDQLISDVNSCLYNAMIIPAEMVDTSGGRCDVVGTSFRAWAHAQGQFCHSPHGKCMGNQLATLRNEDKQRIAKHEQPKYLIGPQRIIGGVGTDPRFRTTMDNVDLKDKTQSFYFSWRYMKEHITSLEVSLDADSIMWITSPSPGEIRTIRTEPHCNALSTTGCATIVGCHNTGNISARYLVMIPYCVDGLSAAVTTHIKPVAPIGITVAPKTTGNVFFALEAVTTNIVPTPYMCKVVLSDSDGRRLDQAVFNITFDGVERVYQGVQQSLWSPKINVTVTSVKEKSLHLSELLGGFKAPLHRVTSQFYDSECNCSIFNVFCVFANFFGCVARTKAMIFSGVGFVGVAATMYVFGPSMSFCLKCFGHRLYSIRQRQQTYLAEAQGSEVNGGKLNVNANERRSDDQNRLGNQDTIEVQETDDDSLRCSPSPRSLSPTQQSVLDDIC